jgi:hypothetical protein
MKPWIKRTLIFAGLWNLTGGAMALADPAGHMAQMYSGALNLSDPLQLYFFRATWINVMAWGVGYVLASRQALLRDSVLAAGGVGKIAYFFACAALYASGAGSGMLLAAGVMDVVFGVFFLAVVAQGLRSPRASGDRWNVRLFRPDREAVEQACAAGSD